MSRVNENLNNAMKGLKEAKFLHAVQMFLAELGDLDHEVQHPAVDGVAHPAQLGQHLDMGNNFKRVGKEKKQIFICFIQKISQIPKYYGNLVNMR